jgi:transposase InsO family protein
MSRTGDGCDNAVAERFFATLKRELVDRPDRAPWPDRAAARLALFDFIEVFSNRRRRHSTLRYLSPAADEAAHQTTAAAAVA